MIGREQILKIHTKKIKIDKEVNLKIIAKSTVGLVGADLENLANEAAILAAREGSTTVKMIHFEDAKDKVMLGVERKSMIITDRDRKITAYHESGHACVSHLLKDARESIKVSIRFSRCGKLIKDFFISSFVIVKTFSPSRVLGKEPGFHLLFFICILNLLFEIVI